MFHAIRERGRELLDLLLPSPHKAFDEKLSRKGLHFILVGVTPVCGVAAGVAVLLPKPPAVRYFDGVSGREIPEAEIEAELDAYFAKTFAEKYPVQVSR